MNMETVKINGPYNFDLLLDRLSIDPIHAANLPERSIKVPLLLNGKPQVAEIKATGTTQHPSFLITGTDEEGITFLSDIFQWHSDLEGIHRHFQETSLHSLFSQFYGMPLALEFDPYSCLLKCIIHQQLNMAFAHKLSQRFVKTFGFEVDGVWFYPPPEKVAQLTVSDLRDLQFSGRKAEYVIGVGEKAASGELDFSKMKNSSDQEISDGLIKLKGVGPWTIQNFLMFGLGRPNLFPFADIGIQNALKKQFGLPVKPTHADMEQMIQGWEPYLSYASLYLWKSIE